MNQTKHTPAGCCAMGLCGPDAADRARTQSKLFALASADWIKTVAHVPTEFVLLSDSQDIEACLASIGGKSIAGRWGRVAGCLFALVGDGEYLAVYMCEYSVPRLDAPVYKLFPRYVCAFIPNGADINTCYQCGKSRTEHTSTSPLI